MDDAVPVDPGTSPPAARSRGDVAAHCPPSGDARREPRRVRCRRSPTGTSTIDTALGFLAVLLLIAANAFFVAAEFALVAVDRTRVDREAETGKRSARIAAAILHRLSFHLSGAQLGITITSLVLGFLTEPLVAQGIEPLLRPVFGTRSAEGASIAVGLALATVFQMVVGELIPKNVAIAQATRSTLVLAPPLRAYSLVFGPVIRFLNGTANWMVRRFGIEPKEELTSVRSLEELELLIRSSGEEGTLDEESLTLLQRSIRFGHKTAADALVPRVDIVGVGHDATVAAVVAAAAETGRTRFPVYRTDLDDLVGVLHVKDVLRLPPEDRGSTPVTTIMRDVYAVPETRDLESLLVELRATENHLAVVVDEFGGTAGIVTVEDLLEEIVGEIGDETDPAAAWLTAAQRQGITEVPGTFHPDEVLDAAGFDVPDGPYETIAGFVLDRLGHIPVVGERVEHDGWTIEVADLDRLRISTVRLIAPGPHPPRNGSRS
jgi:CBS domain containing-hemolysin-like protein